jgi:extracellular elastinolytic metalloproteinase
MKKFLITRGAALLFIGLTFCQITLAQKENKELILDYLKAHQAELNLDDDLIDEVMVDRYTHYAKKGISHYYVYQTYKGKKIVNATAVFAEKNGNVILTGNRLLKSYGSQPSSASPKKVNEILSIIFQNVDPSRNIGEYKLERLEKGKYYLKHNTNKNLDIPVEESYFFEGNNLHFAYDLSLQTTDGQHWWSMKVDGHSAELLEKLDWVVTCNFESCTNKREFNHQHLHAPSQSKMWSMAPAPPPQDDQYRVFAIPAESAIHGPHTLVTGPFNATASPLGWHDTDGVAGEEYTITRGNNVYAFEDRDNDNQPGYSPDGGSSLNFDFPIDSTDNPDQFLDAAITNLFYMNNIMHDVYYQYGFDEQSGNFQVNNYGNGGQAQDDVSAQAQDGSGTNNANFGTPPDGSNPRMQMYLWNPSGGAPLMFYVDSPTDLKGRFASSSANFGPSIPTTPLSGEMVIAIDSLGNDFMDACSPILNPSDVAGKIAFIRKGGGCSYTDKVENCEAAGAIAVVIMNTGLGDPSAMTGTPSTAINIPVLMIGRNEGNRFKNFLETGEPMFVTLFNDGWSGVTDSDFDNGIIAHEYGHGISNRLTGGPNNSGCLGNEDQMGEGWSDWLGLMVTIEPGDVGTTRRGIGVYVQNEPIEGDGIRPKPYSTDFNINSATYNTTNIGSITRPHGIGYVWATMLWDLTWNLIDAHGLDLDLYVGTGGNNIAMELVIEGMKLQACQPGFVDGRDAILEADELLNNSENECLIWRTFAKRGLGELAEQGSTNDRFDQKEDFTIPLFCLAGITDNEALDFVQVFPNPTQDELNIQTISNNKITAIRIVDMNGRVMFEKSDLSVETFMATMHDFHQGIYLVELELEKGKLVKRVVKN